MNSWRTFETFILCQLSVNRSFQAIRSLHFHHLWVHHTVNYIIPPDM